MLLGIVGWFEFSHERLLPIKKVKIHAPFIYVKRESLEKIIMPYAKAGFFHFNLHGTYQHITKLPGVEDVSIRRVWPATIDIKIKEHTALANWENKAIIGTNGDIFHLPDAKIPDGLPLLLGNLEQKQTLLDFISSVKPLFSPYQLKIAILVLDDHGAWHIKFSNGFWLHLGMGGIVGKIDRFISIYKKVTEDNPEKKLAYIDMNYPNAFALKWAGKSDQKKLKNARFG